jgi:hypothetical protein
MKTKPVLPFLLSVLSFPRGIIRAEEPLQDLPVRTGKMTFAEGSFFLMLLLSFVCVGAVVVPVGAAEEPLIPAQLNVLLPKIIAGMSYEAIEKVLSPAYPKLEAQRTLWTGRGEIRFQLDSRFSIAISAIQDAGSHAVVSNNPRISIFDKLNKLQLDIISHPLE